MPPTSWLPSRRRSATGRVTPSEAAEIAKVLDAHVKAYQTAELDERVARAEQMSEAELTRIASCREISKIIFAQVQGSGPRTSLLLTNRIAAPHSSQSSARVDANAEWERCHHIRAS